MTGRHTFAARPLHRVMMAALVLALLGCSGGGAVSTGGSDDDDSETSLLDKWQRFQAGVPTLQMTAAQVSGAWRSAGRRSTHRVILAGPVSVGADPGPGIPVETRPAFPADADACSSGDCDFEPPPDSTWAFAPVLEHDGVRIARFNSRFFETSTLEAHSGAGDRQTDLVDSLTFGGWLEYTHFNVSLTQWCTVGSSGCAETGDTDDVDLLYAGGSVLGHMDGRYSATTPTGTGSATWTGAMVGMEDLASTALRRARPDVVLGDATITIEDLSDPDVDVFFTNIHNVTEATRQHDLSWEDLPLKNGLFGEFSRESDQEHYDHLVGMFSGPGLEEVGGQFRRDGIAGAFGARRQ